MQARPYLIDVADVGAAASTDDDEAGEAVAEIGVLPAELDRVAGAELLGVVELLVAHARGIGADQSDAFHPSVARGERVVGKGLSKSGDVVLERRRRVVGRTVSPHEIRESFGGHDGAAVEHQGGQHDPLGPASDRLTSVDLDDAHRPQHVAEYRTA
jgi:hypothetical protein